MSTEDRKNYALLISSPLAERLRKFIKDDNAGGLPASPSSSPENDAFGVGVLATGLLYGVRATSICPYFPVLVGATKAKSTTKPPTLTECYSGIVPSGIEPAGVFLLLDDDGSVPASLESCAETALSAFPPLKTSDPVAVIRPGSGELVAFRKVSPDGKLERLTLKEVPQSDVDGATVVVRVRGFLQLACRQDEAELNTAFKHALEKVACPYGMFRLDNSDVFFVHTLEPKTKPKPGWKASKQELQDFDAYVEDCHITNLSRTYLEDEPRVAWKLWNEVGGSDVEGAGDDAVEDDGFGSELVAEMMKKKKQKQKQKMHDAQKRSEADIRRQTMDFRLMMKMSGDVYTSGTFNCAPMIHYEKRDMTTVRIPLVIDALGVADKNTKDTDLMETLKRCVSSQVHEMGKSVLSEFKAKKLVSIPEPFHFQPDLLGHPVTVIYAKNGTCDQFSQFRRHLHQAFLLPADRPVFRRMNKHAFDDGEAGTASGKGCLRNVHFGLENGVIGGEVSLVSGSYDYYHYLQGGFNDDGWGCAYRSLQTIISWFRLQGYTATEVPTHEQVQKCLVDVGDKEAGFVGSKQWIGSTEVGFVLERSCDVQCRFLSVSSGEEMASRAGELAEHFRSDGTPVMIGGGVLAHTIIGVEVGDGSSEEDGVRWLILDPHFTGADWTNQGKPNLATMRSKGFVGWKGPQFWKKDAFYNMCLPQRGVKW